MKKHKKHLLAFSSAMFFTMLMGSCGADRVSSDSSTGGSGEVPVDPADKENTIGDAFDPSRPDFGEDFDFDDDYEPLPPPDDNITYKLTFRDGDESPVKFKGGLTEVELKANRKLTTEDFEIADIGRELEGLAVYDAEGETYTTVSLENFAMPRNDTVIFPYWGPAKTFHKTKLSEGKSEGFNFDGVPGDFVGTSETLGTVQNIFRTTDVVINGDPKNNGYPERGVRVDSEVNGRAGSAFRFDTTRKAYDYDWTKENNDFVFQYNVENYGAEAINLNLWQINASSEYKNNQLDQRPHIDIELEPGEVKTLTLKDHEGTNGNFLTYVTVEEDLGAGLHLGISMTAKLDTIIPEDKTVKVGLDLPAGITVADSYVRDQHVNAVLAVPTAEQITNNSGREILGWYLKDSGELINEKTLVLNKDFTIVPYLASATGEDVVFGYRDDSGTTGTVGPDYFGKMINFNNEADVKNESYDKEIRALWTNKTEFADYERWQRLAFPNALHKDDYFRIISRRPIEAKTYIFKYTIVNHGDEAMKFKLHQVASQDKIGPNSGAVASDSITLAPKEKREITIENTYTASNNNTMLLFVLEDELSKADFSVRMNISEPVARRTLTIGGSSSVTFSNGSKTISADNGTKLPDLINLPEGRQIEGWVDENGAEVDLSSWKMPSGDLTVYPYFAAKEGYTRVWLSSGQGGGTPNNCAGGVTEGNFSNIGSSGTSGFENIKADKKTVVKGANGIDEKGVIVQYNANMNVGGQFRYITSGGDATKPGQPGRIEAGTHGFIYNFENRGEEKIDFDVWMVNAGVDTTSCTDNYFTVTLEPGQATTVEITPTYKGGNNNYLTLFRSKVALEKNLKMAVSMSVRYNVK